MPNAKKAPYFIVFEESSSQETLNKNGTHSFYSSSSSSSVEGLKDIVLRIDSAIKSLNNSTTLKITNCHLPEGWPDKIITLVERNENAAYVSFPKGILNAKENERLDLILKPRQQKAKEQQQKVQEKNEEVAEHINKRKSSFRHRFVLLGGLFGVSLSFVFSIPFLSMPTLILGIVGITAGFLSSNIRDGYLSWSASLYKSADISNIENTNKKEAIAAGIKATTWPNYFLSYGKLSTYTHPVAFACGLKKAIDEETEFTSQFEEKLK